MPPVRPALEFRTRTTRILLDRTAPPPNLHRLPRPRIVPRPLLLRCNHWPPRPGPFSGPSDLLHPPVHPLGPPLPSPFNHREVANRRPLLKRLPHLRMLDQGTFRPRYPLRFRTRAASPCTRR